MPEHEGKEVRDRAFWSGNLTFGLVSVPVALYPGNHPRQISLRMLAADGTQLRRRYFCPQEDKMLDSDDIVRGYEFEKGQFVVVTDEELEALEPKKSREIDLRRFVPVEQVNPMYFDKAYILAPAGDSKKPYLLLAEIMERTGRAGIATFVMRGKEYLVAILAENGILRAETLRFSEDIRTPEEVGLHEGQPVDKKAVEALAKRIQGAKRKDIGPCSLEDRYEEKLVQIAQKKRRAGKGVLHVSEEEIEEEEDEEGKAQVIDLMEILKSRMGLTEKENKKKRLESRRPAKPPKDLSRLSHRELYDMAKEMDIQGRSTMTKEELIAEIEVRRQ